MSSVSFKDEIESISAPATIYEIVESMPPVLRSEFLEVVGDQRFAATTIAKVLRKRGYTVSDRAVQRFRNRYLEDNS